MYGFFLQKKVCMHIFVCPINQLYMFQRFLLLVTCSLIPAFSFAQKTTYIPDFIRRDSIQIVRDEWGVPHIYAPTDAEAAYGLAWANAEDDFKTMQSILLIAKGMNGLADGVDGAKIDYAVGMLGVREEIGKRYHEVVSPAFDRYLQGFCAGVNRYAELHPDEVLVKKAFPVKPQDILAGYTLGLSLMSELQHGLTQILDNKLPPISEQKPEGSNGFALAPHKTTDGKAYIAINSHQPLDGVFSWYEVHMVSGEGLNILGGVFPGACVVGHGVNENLAWAHTLSYPDFYDIYQLEMHPRKKNWYRYDGQWKKLQKTSVKLRVRFPKSGIRLGISKAAFRSEHGPVLKNKEGAYAIRMPAFFQLTAAEQWFNMNKARSLAEFREALRMQGLPCFNIVYADKGGNIMYLNNVLLPYRKPGYDWKKVLPGNSSELVWKPEFVPIDSLPAVINPISGYVYNANSTPFRSSGSQDNPDPGMFPAEMGLQTQHWNRARRLEKLFGAKERFSYGDFVNIKYDHTYPDTLFFFSTIDSLFAIDGQQYPDIADAIDMLKRWDKSGDTSSVEASVFYLSWVYFNKRFGGVHFNDEIIVPHSTAFYAECVRDAKKHLLTHFGTINVPLGRLQRHRRGNVDLPLGGMPDMLRAMYSSPRADGTLAPWAGDSYIMLVKFGADGPEIETVNAYGASARPESKHYTDQMPLFVKQQCKPMTLDWQNVLKNAVKIYSPE